MSTIMPTYAEIWLLVTTFPPRAVFHPRPCEFAQPSADDSGLCAASRHSALPSALPLGPPQAAGRRTQVTQLSLSHIQSHSLSTVLPPLDDHPRPAQPASALQSTQISDSQSRTRRAPTSAAASKLLSLLHRLQFWFPNTYAENGEQLSVAHRTQTTSMTNACHFTFFKALSFSRLSVPQSLSSRGTTAYLFKSSLRKYHMEVCNKSESRGALIVLEGLDRCGKTSQCSRLLSYLEKSGHTVESWRFPDRNTGVGQMISSYLANDSQLDDRAIHLLFSANRWEKRSLMESKLRSGTTLIVDRYSFSGVAFSSAKGLDVEWCKAPEVGLLAPDLVVYLDISPEQAAERGGYGGERYEKLEFQRKVAQLYKTLRNDTWKIIDATLPIEDIEKQLRQVVMECVATCVKGKPFAELWQN